MSPAFGVSAPGVTRHFVESDLGRIHYATAGSGDPVLLLHQTPRSWDEYAQVIPVLADHFRVIAMDSLGFGDSARPAGEELTIELLGRGAIALLDALGIAQSAIVGHHTGGIVGLEIAASHSDRVTRAVLSSTPLIDAAWRERIGSAARIDAVTRVIDGTHLLELWHGRQPFYPKDRIDLLERFVVDALRAGWDPADGHHAVQTYRMEEKVDRVSVPVLLVSSTDDPFVYDDIPHLAAALGAPIVEVPGGMIPLPDQFPEKFAQVVIDFLTDPA
jgi:pimeloyl-ACP methyl ester carboxylesterase